MSFTLTPTNGEARGLPDRPTQPVLALFPVSKGRRFRANWYKQFPFLSYHVDTDTVTCHTCQLALSKKLINAEQIKEKAFVTGFKSWKKAIETFKEHGSSSVHKVATEKLTARMSATPITSMVCDAQKKEQAENREAFVEVISTLRGLARGAVAIRGHHEMDGVLRLMLEEHSLSSPALKKWLQRSENFLSHDCQNELVEIMAKMVQRMVVDEIKEAPFFSVIADGTTDVSSREQFSVCLRVMRNLEPIELFVGLYDAPHSDSETLFKVVLDVFQRLGLDVNQLRGHCFDGASNMSGRVAGLRAKLSELQPASVYIHCCNHALDLVLVEEAKRVNIIKNAMEIVRDVSNSLDTAKRQNMFREFVCSGGPDGTENNKRKPQKLLALCPTRWTVRAQAYRRLLDYFDAVVDTLNALTQDRSSSEDARSKLRGQISRLKSFECLFGISLSVRLFEPCELLARLLQKTAVTASEVTQGAAVLLSTLEEMRHESSFDTLFEEVEAMAQKLRTPIAEPKAPRVSRPPKRLEQQPCTAPSTSLDARSGLRKAYYEAVDLIISEAKRRFDQPGLKTLARVEGLLLGRATGLASNELKGELGPWSNDVCVELLSAQLRCLRSNLPTSTTTLTDLFKWLRSQNDMARTLLSEVVRLAELYGTVPMSGASAERSFSTLRCVKAPYRSTMSQSRLTHLMLLSVYKDRAGALNRQQILKEFVERRPERRVRAFGKL